MLAKTNRGFSFLPIPLALAATVTFLVTTLVFPVATQSGTYLHAAAPGHVLLIISGLAGSTPPLP